MSSDSHGAAATDPGTEPDLETTLVDGRCCGCKEVSTYLLDGSPEEWGLADTFFQHCRVCSEETPTNIIAFRWGSMEIPPGHRWRQR